MSGKVNGKGNGKSRRGPPSRKVAAWLPIEKADAVRRHAEMAGMSEAAYVADALDRSMGRAARRSGALPATMIHAELQRLRAALLDVGKDPGTRIAEFRDGLARVEAMMRTLTPLVLEELGP